MTLSCILCCSSYHVVVEEGQGRLQANILPCQALTAAMGRMSDNYSPAFSHLYLRSHLPPSKTLIILHFVVPVHASVIPCHHCMQRLLPLIIVVIAKAKGQLSCFVFFSLLFTQFSPRQSTCLVSFNLNKLTARISKISRKEN